MLDTNICVKTENFDGPMALLLLLIQKEQMNIRSLDLNKITKEYLVYLQKMHELNFNIAGDYLYLAATLLLLKSNSCITEEEVLSLCEDEAGATGTITTQAELVRRLEELERYQKLGKALWSLPKAGYEIFTKPRVNRKEIADSILSPIDLEKLTTTMMDLLSKQKRQYKAVKRDRISIKEKLVTFKERLIKDTTYTFDELLQNETEKRIDDIIITFISVLELAKLKKVSLYQNEEKSNIYIKILERISDLDVCLAEVEEQEVEAEAGVKSAELAEDIAAVDVEMEERLLINLENIDMEESALLQ
ncbi:MAG: hypothetical protein A2381_01395 [Bdellovibrionales bacterium RIFOXYB1_FULL_37_110]|nr:MAG: hypothetical protein A2417_02250 [Bdellovibrionales bacterium RIFOXYC1_FULL_37_79]OFZ58872.1 MAG: hypothetical protein A2381_01395 [Bdellovibrionales bacterium RIFOXYB1_FULL_37_110]OFZ64682.1 MAG: hypothetical protein A2577_13540 [Bdellovibrionales bacterium RIFOXYD1_FULL_36_51]